MDEKNNEVIEQCFSMIFTGMDAIQYVWNRLKGYGDQTKEVLEADLGDVLVDLYDMIVLIINELTPFMPKECPNKLEEYGEKPLELLDEIAGTVMEGEIEKSKELVAELTKSYKRWSGEVAVIKVASEFDDFEDQMLTRWNQPQISVTPE